MSGSLVASFLLSPHGRMVARFLVVDEVVEDDVSSDAEIASILKYCASA